MSLSISWTMAAAGWDRGEVINRMGDLRRFAVSLPFEVVDELQVGMTETGFIAHYNRGAESTAIILHGDPVGVWSGHGQTKTLYAGRPQYGGDENFLCAHMSVVAVLDAAVRMGFRVDVHDGSGFWIERDLRALLVARRHDDDHVSSMVGKTAEYIGMHMDGAEMPDAPAAQDVDQWRRNQAINALLDLVVRIRR